MSAATSKLAIVNLALAHLKEESTDTLSADLARNVVRKVLPFVDMARDLVLSLHGWQEALEFTTLSAAADEAGDFRYPYYYWLDGDCLRIWEMATTGVVWQAGKRQKNGAERHIIRADSEGPLNVIYVRRLGWDGIGPQLADAIALKIAAYAAGPVQGDEARGRTLKNEFTEALRTAAGRDGQQQGGQPVPFPSRLLALRQGA
jgi:hypothetical protein